MGVRGLLPRPPLTASASPLIARWKQETNCSIGRWRLPLVGTIVHHTVLSGPRSERSDSELTDWLAVYLKCTACVVQGDVFLPTLSRESHVEVHALVHVRWRTDTRIPRIPLSHVHSCTWTFAMRARVRTVRSASMVIAHKPRNYPNIRAGRCSHPVPHLRLIFFVYWNRLASLG